MEDILSVFSGKASQGSFEIRTTIEEDVLVEGGWLLLIELISRHMWKIVGVVEEDLFAAVWLW